MTLSAAWKQLSWFYYQYLLVTALYMLEPWERTVFIWVILIIPVGRSCSHEDKSSKMMNVAHELVNDSLLISVAGMAVYTGYVFMPQHIMAILHYFEVLQ